MSSPSWELEGYEYWDMEYSDYFAPNGPGALTPEEADRRGKADATWREWATLSREVNEIPNRVQVRGYGGAGEVHGFNCSCDTMSGCQSEGQ